MQTLLALQGDIGFLNEPLGTYRRHPGGLSSGQTSKDDLKMFIHSSDVVSSNIDPKYGTAIRTKALQSVIQLIFTHASRGETAEAKACVNQYARRCLALRVWPRKEIVKLGLKLHAPFFYESVKTLCYWPSRRGIKCDSIRGR